VNVHHDDEARKTKNGEMRTPYLARQMSKWFYDTSIGAATGAARCGSFVGGHISLGDLAIREYGGHEDLRGSGRRSVIPYVHG
jgi:hypothetical protein